MKHIKIYEDFTNEAAKLNLQNDIFDSGLGGYKDWTFDPAKKKLTVVYDRGKWDNKGRYEKEIKWLATNDRSAMTSGNSLVGHLDLYLQPHGLEVDKKKQHKYDLNTGKVELNLTDAHPDNHWYGHSVWENDETIDESTFTVEDAIKIQSEQLAQWKKLLQPKVYKDLEKWATEHNDKAESGNQIIRGTDMDNFIGNYFNSYTPSNKR